MSFEIYYLFERVEHIFNEFLFFLLKQREAEIGLYLYDLMRHAPIDGERGERWFTLCNEVVGHLRAHTVPEGFLCSGNDRPSLYAKMTNSQIDEGVVGKLKNDAETFRDYLVYYLHNVALPKEPLRPAEEMPAYCVDVPFAEALEREKAAPRWVRNGKYPGYYSDDDD